MARILVGWVNGSPAYEVMDSMEQVMGKMRSIDLENLSSFFFVDLDTNDKVATSTVESLQANSEESLRGMVHVDILDNEIEMAYLMLEQVIALLESLKLSKAEIKRFIDYVYAKPHPTRDPNVGSVALALSNLANAKGLNLGEEWLKAIAKHNSEPYCIEFRKEQETKEKRGFCLKSMKHSIPIDRTRGSNTPVEPKRRRQARKKTTTLEESPSL